MRLPRSCYADLRSRPVTISASVVVPTHNRPASLLETVSRALASCKRGLTEVVVVDDGSTPPLEVPSDSRLRIVRTTGVERSRARNAGAHDARGSLLIFIDDDISVTEDFVHWHMTAAQEFGDVLAVGRVSLPAEATHTPFGRFRRTIEEPSQARPRGVVAEENFCTAANMSIRRETFLSLGGFDPEIVSGEDQDLALRFSERGGRIVFLPEASVIHRDTVADAAAYARRHEWGAQAMTPFLRRYPDRPENIVRRRLGRSLREARFPGETGPLLVRTLLSHDWCLGVLRGGIVAAERGGLSDSSLFYLYRALLGLHLFRGFRTGMAGAGQPPPLPRPLAGGGRGQ